MDKKTKNMKGISAGAGIAIAVVVAVFGMLGVFYIATMQQIARPADTGADIAQAIVSAPRQFSGYDVKKIIL